jgi:hypothetical protein
MSVGSIFTTLKHVIFRKYMNPVVSAEGIPKTHTDTHARVCVLSLSLCVCVCVCRYSRAGLGKLSVTNSSRRVNVIQRLQHVYH